jgi:sugar/nucleoside kinase (ribokinase family)
MLPPHILVIGAVSLDTVHLPNQHIVTRPIASAGGAAYYTSLAAQRAGARVTMLAVKPSVIPTVLQSVSSLVNWVGPQITLDTLPRLEIAHYGGGKAQLLHASWGAEPQLTPAYLPADLTQYDMVHIAALSSAQRQHEFFDACRARGAKCISVGVYARVVYGETETVRQLHSSADLFFMNENEARGLFGSVERAHTAPGNVLYVTLGELGANVVTAESTIHIPAPNIVEFNPTGAGDTFCGTALTALANGATAVEAAEQGVRAASAHVANVNLASYDLYDC